MKRENDVHCTYQRVSWSAVFRRAERLSPHMLRQLKREHCLLLPLLLFGCTLLLLLAPKPKLASKSPPHLLLLSPPLLQPTNPAGVRAFFPNLPSLLHLSDRADLPAHLDHHQSKTYWDASYGGVQGTVQLYAESPDKASALDGGLGLASLRLG